MILIGFIAYRATKNFSDYILGGRSLGSFVTRVVGGRLDMSGWLLMGLPGAIFVAGLSESWIAIGLIVGAWLNWIFVAGRLRAHRAQPQRADAAGLLHRFEDESRMLRIFSALVILVFFTIYCARAWSPVRDCSSPPWHAVRVRTVVGAAATILYVFIGGFLAVSWTDTVQATLMIFCAADHPGVRHPRPRRHGHRDGHYRSVEPGQLRHVPRTVLCRDHFAAGVGLGYFGQPHILVRFMAADSIKTIPNARRIGMTWMILTLAGAVAVGFSASPTSPITRTRPVR